MRHTIHFLKIRSTHFVPSGFVRFWEVVPVLPKASAHSPSILVAQIPNSPWPACSPEHILREVGGTTCFLLSKRMASFGEVLNCRDLTFTFLVPLQNSTKGRQASAQLGFRTTASSLTYFCHNPDLGAFGHNGSAVCVTEELCKRY